jgi:hypothetical protein
MSAHLFGGYPGHIDPICAPNVMSAACLATMQNGGYTRAGSDLHPMQLRAPCQQCRGGVPQMAGLDVAELVRRADAVERADGASGLSGIRP